MANLLKAAVACQVSAIYVRRDGAWQFADMGKQMQDVQDELNEVDLGDAVNSNETEADTTDDISSNELWYDREGYRPSRGDDLADEYEAQDEQDSFVNPDNQRSAQDREEAVKESQQASIKQITAPAVKPVQRVEQKEKVAELPKLENQPRTVFDNMAAQSTVWTNEEDHAPTEDSDPQSLSATRTNAHVKHTEVEKLRLPELLFKEAKPATTQSTGK